jgi:hypothetical protein
MIYEAPEYDLAYVANVGFRLDLWVLAKSLPATFLHSSIDSLDDVPASLLRAAPGSPAPVEVVEEVL